MSSQEVTGDNLNAESKQLTGSSKRKRKSSTIKHNVVNSDKSQGTDASTSPRPVRTYAKRARGEKGRMAKEKLQCELENALNDAVVKEEVNDIDATDSLAMGEQVGKVCEENFNEERELKSEPSDAEASIEKPKGKGKSDLENEDVSCTGKQQQCQNCNFCAEHKAANSESESKSEQASKTYICKTCMGYGLRRVYNSLEKYKRHMRESHEPKKDVKKFICTDCPEPVWFPTKSKYCYHLGAKHPGVIKFVCEVCTQTFKLKANYKNHIKTHNIVVQKKFSCDVCGGTFVNRAGFEAHKRRFPGPHIKQSCVHCGISFSKEKHMKNHRCKILLLEEAAAARDSNKNSEAGKTEKVNVQEQMVKDSEVNTEVQLEQPGLSEKRVTKEEGSSEVELEEGKKQGGEDDPQGGKRVLLHRLVPKKNEKVVYKQIPLQMQNVPQSVVVQEFREIDLEGGTFITTEPDHQIIVRDVNGHLVQGNQILQLDINDFQQGEESQVCLPDWNVVVPFVIRGKSP